MTKKVGDPETSRSLTPAHQFLGVLGLKPSNGPCKGARFIKRWLKKLRFVVKNNLCFPSLVLQVSIRLRKDGEVITRKK